MITVSGPSVNRSFVIFRVKVPVSAAIATVPVLIFSAKSTAIAVPVLVQYSVPVPKLVVVIVHVTAAPSLTVVMLGCIV
jgi:hypothetical protein